MSMLPGQKHTLAPELTQPEFLLEMERLGAWKDDSFGPGWTVWKAGPDRENYAQVNVHTHEMTDRVRFVMIETLKEGLAREGWTKKLQ